MVLEQPLDRLKLDFESLLCRKMKKANRSTAELNRRVGCVSTVVCVYECVFVCLISGCPVFCVCMSVIIAQPVVSLSVV